MKEPTKTRKSDVVVYVTRSGPKKGQPDCEAAFQTREEAIRFLADLHGLTFEETRELKRSLGLKLKKKHHGSEYCAISEEPMDATTAKLALTGELYLPAQVAVLKPIRLRKSA